MSTSVLAHLTSALDLVILERMPAGSLNAVPGAPTPPWFLRIVRDLAPERPVDLIEALPVLAGFLSEAEALWQGGTEGRLEGEPFVIDNSGEVMPVSATAVTSAGRHFLLIQRAPGFEERAAILQRARERTLERESIVARIQTLRPPVAKAGELLDQLASTELNERQREQIAGIRRHLETLHASLEALPHLPRAATARSGRS